MSASPRRLFIRGASAGAFIGLLVAALMMYVAWQHNPDGVFHEAGAIHGPWFLLGIAWFAPFLFLGALIGALLAFRVRKSAT